MVRYRCVAIIAVALFVIGCVQPEPSAEWPSFRGPGGMGLSSDTGLPVTWSEEEGVLWKVEMKGRGNSTPIVTAGRVFLTGTERVGPDADEGSDEAAGDVGTAGPDDLVVSSNQLERFVTALDFDSGEQLWRTTVFADRQERLHRMNSAAAPSAVTDGTHVFVYFGSVVASLDLDGNLVWTQEIEPQYARFSRYGAASSPVLTDNAVILVQDREYSKRETDDIGWIAAYAKDDGRELWRKTWDDSCCSYTTPVVMDRGAGEEIIYAHSGYVASYSPDTGERLWQHDYEINQIVSGPVIDGDLLVIAGGAHNVRSTLGVRLTGAGRQTTTEQLWVGGRMVPETSSGVLYDGLMFTVTIKGILVCRDAETGEIVWKRRLEQRGNHAALVAGDGKIYVGQGYGKTSVVSASREFKQLAQNHLGEEFTTASPALVGGSILLRTPSYLYRVVGIPGS